MASAEFERRVMISTSAYSYEAARLVVDYVSVTSCGVRKHDPSLHRLLLRRGEIGT